MSVTPKPPGRKTSPSSPVPAPDLPAILPRLLSILALLVIAVTSVSRIRLSHIPMSRDEGTYGYLGQLAAKGLTPYVDFYEMKPPVLFYLYGLGGSIFGFTDLGLRLFGLLLVLISSAMIFLILRQYAPQHMALIGAALFSILSLNPFAFGFAMVAEHIVNALVLSSCYLLHLNTTRKGSAFLLWAGIVFSLAILTKQTAILLSPVLLMYLIQSRRQKPWLKQSLVFAGGVIIPVAVIGIWFLLRGSMDEAWYWLTTYPRKYATVITPQEGLEYLRIFGKRITLFQVSLFIAFGFLAVSALAWIRKKHVLLFWIYLILALLTIIPGFRFYGQYWLLVFAPMALLTGAALHQLDGFKKGMGLVSAFGCIVLMAGEMIIHRDYYFNSGTPGEVEVLYTNNPFGAVRQLATYAGDLMKADDTFMVLGSEPQAYLYADKIAPTRHVFMSMISKHDETSKAFIDEALHDLQFEKPTYVLANFFMYSWGITTKSNDQLYLSSYRHLKNHYTPIVAYDMNTRSYLHASEGAVIDLSQANRIILFKLK